MLSEYKEACVHYISGFVVFSLEKNLHCMQCSEALSSSDNAAHEFIVMKDRGKLKRPSKTTSFLCLEAEKCFQRLLTATQGMLPQGGGVAEAVSTSVLMNIEGKELFPQLHEHQFDTTVGENHVLKLIKKVVSKYTQIRLFHMGKKMTQSVNLVKVRNQLTKTYQFLGQ